MYACEYCQKEVQVGRHLRHHRGVAGGRWKRKAPKTGRLWLPNLHNVRVIENGKVVRRRLCTKCLRRAQRPQAVPVKSVEKPSEKQEIAHV